MDIPSPFGTDEADFDDYDAFVPGHLPEPGPFLDDTDVLTGADHAAFHETTRDLFEERSVHDATFGYNLARLNLDTRHPGAGFRYGVEAAAVLRAEFTPTTAFCPQSDTLCVGAFRAWNGLAERHDYELVRVRVAPMHQRARAINERLRSLEAETDFEPAPVAAEAPAAERDDATRPANATDGDGPASAGREDGPSTPF